MSVTVVAEIGINHNGDIGIALDLIQMAKGAGCDYVKFQKREIEIVYSQQFLHSPRKSPWGETQRDQKRGLEFGETEYLLIDEYCKEKNISWFASAWDSTSLQFLDRFDCPHQKVASAMITHPDFLKAVAERKKHTFISTGMATMKMIEDVLDIFARKNCPHTIMHAVASYPCLDKDTNLSMITKLLERFGPPVGYSSHDVGVGPSIIAVALGATVIEKHITLDRAAYGSDQSASMEKKGLEYLVKECRNVANCMGNGRKAIQDVEQDVARKLRYWEER